MEKDNFSYANISDFRISHAHIEWKISFIKQCLYGNVVLTVLRDSIKSNTVILDTRNLHIVSAQVSDDNKYFSTTTFYLSETDPVKGQALFINVTNTTKYIYQILYNLKKLWIAMEYIRRWTSIIIYIGMPNQY